MSNRIVQFAEKIEGLSEEAVYWCHSVLADSKKARDELKLNEIFGADPDNWPGFECVISTKRELYLRSCDGANLENLTAFVMNLIVRFMPNYVFRLSASISCDRVKMGEFGGQWVVISRDGIREGTTWDAAEEAATFFEEVRHIKKLTEAIAQAGHTDLEVADSVEAEKGQEAAEVIYAGLVKQIEYLVHRWGFEQVEEAFLED